MYSRKFLFVLGYVICVVNARICHECYTMERLFVWGVVLCVVYYARTSCGTFFMICSTHIYKNM